MLLMTWGVHSIVRGKSPERTGLVMLSAGGSIVVPGPQLAVSLAGGSIVITFTGMLQSSTTVAGGWTDVGTPAD